MAKAKRYKKRNDFTVYLPNKRFEHVYNEMSDMYDRMRNMMHAQGCKSTGCPGMCKCYKKRSKPLDLHTALFWNSLRTWSDLLDHCREVFYWWQEQDGKMSTQRWDNDWIWQCLRRPYGSDTAKWSYILKGWKKYNRIVDNALGLHRGKYSVMTNQFEDMNRYLNYAREYLRNGSSGSMYAADLMMAQIAGRIKRRKNLGGKQI